MSKYEKGQIIDGTVSGIEKYGIFIKIDKNQNGLVHISEISYGFVKDPNDFAKVGDDIKLKIIDIDDKTGQFKLSIKQVKPLKSKKRKRKKIVETSQGFDTLKSMLPVWIKKNLKR